MSELARKFQAARGRAMSEERLSRLQRATLECLYRNGANKKGGYLPHAGLISFVGERLGKVHMTFFGRDVRGSFQSVFSQSLRNLEGKGMVELWKGWRRIIGIRITEKGEGALSLTCKLGIREEAKAALERANKKVEAWLEGKSIEDITDTVSVMREDKHD